jgi:DUF1009 family protein
MPPKLGILAGGGELPSKLIQICRSTGREVFVVALQGHADPAALGDVAHAEIRLGAAGDILDRLKAERVEELVMAGGVRRPSFAELQPDARALKILAKVGYTALGDGSLLSALARVLESEGFRVVGPDDLVAELLAPEGPLGRLEPDDRLRADIALGIASARAIGADDIGQGAVVRNGVIVGTEGSAGTDALIARCAGPGGVLVKVKKPEQDRRLDLPSIGVETVRNAAAAGLAGIAVEAGGALVIDRAEVAETADAAGLFVIGVAAR